jgi:hypothetical protein
VLSLIDKLGKVWGEPLLKGDACAEAFVPPRADGLRRGDDEHGDGDNTAVDRSTSGQPSAERVAAGTSAYLARFPLSTRVEARISCSSIADEFYPPSPDALALLRVIHIPASSSDVDLEACAFQRELLDPCFAGVDTDADGSDAELDEMVLPGPTTGPLDEAVGLRGDRDDDDGRAAHAVKSAAGAAAGTVTIRRWNTAPALQLSALAVSVDSVVAQISGIATLLTEQLRGRGQCAALLPFERLGCALLTLACGFTSHGLLARARELIADHPAETSRYAAAAGYAFLPDSIALARGDVGSDVDCTSLSLRRHIGDHRDRYAVGVTVCDVHMLSETVAEIMNALVSWRVKAPADKKYGATSGRLRMTAKAVHITGQKLMLWGMCAPSGGVAAGACFSRAEALVRIWQCFSIGVRLQLATHAAAGCRLVVGSDGATISCVCAMRWLADGDVAGHFGEVAAGAVQRASEDDIPEPFTVTRWHERGQSLVQRSPSLAPPEVDEVGTSADATRVATYESVRMPASATAPANRRNRNVAVSAAGIAC